MQVKIKLKKAEYFRKNLMMKLALVKLITNRLRKIEKAFLNLIVNQLQMRMKFRLAKVGFFGQQMFSLTML